MIEKQLILLEALKVGVIEFDNNRVIESLSDRAKGLWPAVVGKRNLEDFDLPIGLGTFPTVIEGGLVLRQVLFPEGGGALLVERPESETHQLRRCLAFYSSLLHDLRNPMAGVRMLAQAFELEMGQKSRSTRTQELCETYIPKIISEVGRMARYLDFTRYLTPPEYETGHSRVVISCLSVVQRVIKNQQLVCQRLGVTLSCVVNGDIAIQSDSVRLFQAVKDLLGVALMGAVARGSTLSIGAEIGTAMRAYFFIRAKRGEFGERWNNVLSADDPSPKSFTGQELALLTTRHLAECSGGSLEMIDLGNGEVEGRLYYALVSSNDDELGAGP